MCCPAVPQPRNIAPPISHTSIVCRVERKASEGGYCSVCTTAELQCKATDLQPACQHVFRVQAVNCAGQSEWSPEASVQTKLLPPTPPGDVKLSLKNGYAPFASEGIKASAARLSFKRMFAHSTCISVTPKPPKFELHVLVTSASIA